MRCTKCGTESGTGRKFCANCGSALAIRCPKRTAENEPLSKFCEDCGAALTEAPSNARVEGVPLPQGEIHVAAKVNDSDGAALEGERKTVTALFADIKGSMELMEDLDPEEARAIVDPALKLMIDAVHRYGGFVVQSTGDGIFALFGAPVAHEDHPLRALYAALRIQEEIRRYGDHMRTQGQAPLQVRVGVNLGEVVVRSIQTATHHTEYSAIGHSTSLAARLQTLATPGSIVISGSMKALVEGYFQLKRLGPTTIKGVTDPVELFEVTGLGPLRTRLQRAAGRGLTKFVGRQREMDALKHAAEQARAGRGQIVAVMADPGVGKSRLFHEFKATSQSGWMVLEAFSVSHGKASAYLPVIELLSAYFEISRDDDERKRRERILGKMLGLDRNLEDALPYLYSLHGISEAGDSLAQMEPPVRRRRTLEAIKRILLRESLNQPLMLVFEDLHWIDSETQALLNLLVDAIANARILLLVNYRPEYRHDWSSRTHYTQLRLDPLARESAEEMLSALLGHDQHLVPLKQLIIERTEGTPFFMEEMVQVLFEDGVLQRNGAVKLAKPISTVKVPASVQAVLASRIDRLEPTEKELLQTLAVIGREFTLALVQQVTLKSSNELEQLLSRLQLGEFIDEQPAVGEAEYSFKHVLTQEVAYNSILIERRKVLHERAGEEIERLFPDRLDNYVTDLARHYERGGNVAKAVEYLGRAGQRALEQGAPSEAAGSVRRALELIKQLQDGTEHARSELELLMVLSASLFMMAGPGSPEGEQALARALELCEQLGDSRIMEVMLSLAALQWSRSEPLLALHLSEKVVALAEQAKDVDVLAGAHASIAVQVLMLGQLEKARQHFERAVELSSGRPIRTFGQASAMVRSAPLLLTLLLLALGYPITALKRSEDALDSVRLQSDRFFSTVARVMYVMTHLWLRDIRSLAEQVEQLVAFTAEHELPIGHAIGTFYRGWLMVDAGRVEEGLFEMHRIITRFSGVYPPVEWLVAAFGEVCVRHGLPNEGLPIVEDALARTQKTPFFQAELNRVKGELMLLKDPNGVEEPERCFRQGIDIARRQAARLFELRATTSLARLLGRKGRHQEARTMLAEIYNWFTEGFDTADLKEAKALLDQPANLMAER
jgi:class 3 adenylate cyclase/tetratricopeptide (TPR) repeat protein